MRTASKHLPRTSLEAEELKSCVLLLLASRIIMSLCFEKVDETRESLCIAIPIRFKDFPGTARRFSF